MSSDVIKQILANASPRSGLTAAQVQALRDEIERLRAEVPVKDRHEEKLTEA